MVVVPNMDMPTVSLYWGDSANGIASWSENKDNAFDFLTLLYTDEDIANLIQYGVEDQTYTLQDGKAEYLDGNDLWVYGENFTNPLITYSQAEMADDKRAYLDRYYEACEPDMPDGFRFDIDPVEDEVNAANGVFDSELINSFITLKADNIDEALNEINSSLQEAGIQEIIEEANRQLEDWGNEN